MNKIKESLTDEQIRRIIEEVRRIIKREEEREEERYIDDFHIEYWKSKDKGLLSEMTRNPTGTGYGIHVNRFLYSHRDSPFPTSLCLKDAEYWKDFYETSKLKKDGMTEKYINIYIYISRQRTSM